ncbi:MAG: hypothetical protein ACKO2K_03730 [Alphaproteobacteria bacterium]
MNPRFLAAAVACALVASAATARAQLVEPAHAKRLNISFVTAYEECVTPNDSSTGAFVLPACSPAIPIDATCQFGPRGLGNGRAAVVETQVAANQDIRINGYLRGLEAGCEGETLCIEANMVVTLPSTGCVSGDPAGCTMQELTNFPLGCATVKNGRARLGTTVNAPFPPNSPVINGQMAIALREVKVTRQSSVNGPAPSGPTFEMGLFVPQN